MHEEIVKLFKKNVPRQKKIYQMYMQDCKIQNFSYVNFKKNNVALIEIKEHLIQLDEYYYLSQNQIDNIFTYLKQNISVDNFSKLRKVYKSLNELSDYLNERYSSKDSLHGDTSINNCLYIIDKIVELKSFIANKMGNNVIEIEKTISFELAIKKILNPKEYKFDETKLLYLIENFNPLLHKDRNNNDFNYNFCRCVERAKVNREREKLNYYKSIYSYLITVKEFELDYEYLNVLFEVNHKDIDQNIIDRKIRSMRIHPKTGRRMVEDYTISIDTDITKKIDDAFSIESVGDAYLLGIHLADVYSLGYFEEDSMDVNQKGNVNKSKASLSKNKLRNATTIYVLVDSNGLVRNYKVLNTTLKADANLVYEDIPHLIRSDEVNPELKNTVINLLLVYNLLENEKFPNNPTIQNFAYLITSKLMMLCCTLYSEEYKKNDLTAIYLCGINNDNYYSLQPEDYYTGFDDYNTYARVTSPIYDRASLINQFITNRYLIPEKSIDEEERKELVYKLTNIVDKLNK